MRVEEDEGDRKMARETAEKNGGGRIGLEKTEKAAYSRKWMNIGQGCKRPEKVGEKAEGGWRRMEEGGEGHTRPEEDEGKRRRPAKDVKRLRWTAEAGKIG